MIDISHSMILYGEDRITPAKKVAMALSELITTRYPKDTLDILVFGNDAWTIKIKDLPYLQVGPYHTNTIAEQFTKANQGKAYYSGLNGLGEFIFRDYKHNKSRRNR